MVSTIPSRINRSFIQAHPDWIFVYSNDLLRKGCEGMAWHFIGEPNTFMVPTMYKYCNNPKYFQDINYDYWSEVILGAINAIPRDGRPIVVVEKIGMGCSRMHEFAPRLLALIKSELNKIKC